jgi:hypothetical protein
MKLLSVMPFAFRVPLPFSPRQILFKPIADSHLTEPDGKRKAEKLPDSFPIVNTRFP